MLRTISTLAITILLTISCGEDEVKNLDNFSDETTSTSDAIDKALIDSLLEGQAKGDPFRILSIKMESEVIKLKVEYSGGCEDHDFSLVWNGECDGFSDKQAKLAIVHNANGDNCEALVTEDIVLDFYTIMKGKTAIEGCGGFTFINASNSLSYYFSNAVTYYLKDEVQGWECSYNVELEEVMCGYGFLENLWFKNSAKSINEEYDYFYFQPINIAVDQTFEKGKYKIGVRIVENYESEVATCLAYPGPSLPAEILCIEKID